MNRNLISSALILSLIGFRPDKATAQSLANGLVVCYLMDGNATDAGQNGFHGVTNASNGTDRHGNVDGALAFNGSTSYFDLPNDPLLKPAFPFTVSLWMRASANTAGLYTSDYEDEVYKGFWVALNLDGTININCGNGGSIGPGSRSSEFSNMVFQLDQWYLLTAVFLTAHWTWNSMSAAIWSPHTTRGKLP